MPCAHFRPEYDRESLTDRFRLGGPGSGASGFRQITARERSLCREDPPVAKLRWLNSATGLTV
jgi:hypothetical protein